MLPAQRNKVDISKLTPDEQKTFRLYGKLPARPVAKSQERKYFDSGDWALSRSGKAEHANVSLGKSMPKPDEIPHASPTPIGSGGSSSTGGGSSPPTSGNGLVGTPASTPGVGVGSQPMSFGAGSPTGSSPGAHPLALGHAHHTSTGESGINLSMSPGRVGVGQPLATSPTRSFGGAAAGLDNHRISPTSATSPGFPGQQNPLVGRLENDAHARSPAVLPGQSPMVSGTTGNQIGKTQMRRTSQSEGVGLSAASPPPTSGLARSISASDTNTEDDAVAGMELQ